MEFVGRTLKKEFKGAGVVTGQVNSYNESSDLFNVVYEDGNKEELGMSEVFLLMTEDNSFGVEEINSVKEKDRCRPPPNPLFSSSTKRCKQTARMMTVEESWYWRKGRLYTLSGRNSESESESESESDEDYDNGDGDDVSGKDLSSKAEKTEANDDVLIREPVSCQQSKGGESEELNLKTAETDNKLELEENCVAPVSYPISIEAKPKVAG